MYFWITGCLHEVVAHTCRRPWTIKNIMQNFQEVTLHVCNKEDPLWGKLCQLHMYLYARWNLLANDKVTPSWQHVCLPNIIIPNNKNKLWKTVGLISLFSYGNKVLHVHPHKFLPVMSYIVQFIHVTFSTERHVNNGTWMNINNYYLLWWVLNTQSL